jgi:hypothetical protein
MRGRNAVVQRRLHSENRASDHGDRLGPNLFRWRGLDNLYDGFGVVNQGRPEFVFFFTKSDSVRKSNLVKDLRQTLGFVLSCKGAIFNRPTPPMSRLGESLVGAIFSNNYHLRTGCLIAFFDTFE